MKKHRGKKSQRPADEVADTASSRDAGTSRQSSVRAEVESPAAPPSPATSSAPTLGSIPILLAHFAWYLLGPLCLFLALLGIVRAGTGWATVLDFVCVVVVAAMVFSRWIEQRSGQAVTMSGEPSTWDDFRRYSIRLPLLVIALWIVANVLGNHWFQGNAGF